MYKVADFDYHLPDGLIAQKPLRPRDRSRLLVLSRRDGEIEHRRFRDIIDYLQPGDLLVLNNSKVFPARLIGKKAESGGKIEIFLHRNDNLFKVPAADDRSDNVWECLIGGRIRSGQEVDFPKGLSAKVLRDNADGTWQVRFNLKGQKFWRVINTIGSVPLPPYIKRSRRRASDESNYQTVFADDTKIGSVAAPTAGLHFTEDLLKKLKMKGVKIEYVTLHVGLGTFAPVKTEQISDHKMHSEFVIIGKRTVQAILEAKREHKRVIAVGTTSARALESSAGSMMIGWADRQERGAIDQNQAFWTNIFIYPGYRFKVVDGLITNFHLPKSTLLMLVSALAGKKAIDNAYREALGLKYRFFSYGDAMFIY